MATQKGLVSAKCARFTYSKCSKQEVQLIIQLGTKSKQFLEKE